MQNITTIILPAAKINRGYGESLLKDIKPGQFARKPLVGGVLLEVNHPAFHFGHLTIYHSRILNLLGSDSHKFELPASYQDLFKQGAVCLDDPKGNIYPGMEELTSGFFRGYDEILPVLADVSDEKLLAPLSDEKMQARFGSVGGAVNYLLINHIRQHLGQLSAWRRCMGLGPASQLA